MIFRKTRFIAVLLLALAAIGALPAFAHGPERHGETEAIQMKTGGPASAAPCETESGEAATQAGTRESISVVGIFSNLHPAAVHFPIALFVTAAIVEAFAMLTGTTNLNGTVRVMIYGGAAGALIAALLGWVHTGLWLGGDATMQWHRWVGTGTAAVGLALAIVARSEGESRSPLRALLFALAAAMVAQGYWGGELAHGTDHLA